MTYSNLPLLLMTVCSLAACGDRTVPPAEPGDDPAHETPEPPQDSGSDPETLQELLNRVSMAGDDRYTPQVTATDDRSLMLAGQLETGEWRELGARGLGFGRPGFEPAAMFRCSADRTQWIVAVPQPDADRESADDTTDPALAGSLITQTGQVTGDFQPSDALTSTLELAVSVNDPALQDLAPDGRIGISLEGQDTRLLPVSDAWLTQLGQCANPATG